MATADATWSPINSSQSFVETTNTLEWEYGSETTPAWDQRGKPQLSELAEMLIKELPTDMQLRTMEDNGYPWMPKLKKQYQTLEDYHIAIEKVQTAIKSLENEKEQQGQQVREGFEDAQRLVQKIQNELSQRVEAAVSFHAQKLTEVEEELKQLLDSLLHHQQQLLESNAQKQKEEEAERQKKELQE